MKFSIFLTGLFFCVNVAFAQDSLKKTNPVIYGESNIGIAVAGVSGFQYGLGLNYQAGKSLFTLRYIGIASIGFGSASVTPFTALPSFHNNGGLDEYALLYGRRLIDGGHSFSFSLGASFNKRQVNYRDNVDLKQHIISRYIGVPFEANVLWFKEMKKRYHIYGIFPVGKPTALGNSIGIKLSGNISQHSYIGFGLVIGLGTHKYY